MLIQPFPDHKAPKDFKARWVLRVLLAQTLLWRDPLVLKAFKAKLVLRVLLAQTLLWLDPLALKAFKVKLDPKAPQD